MRRTTVWLGLVGVAAWAAVPAVSPRHGVDLLVFAGLYSIAGLGVAFLLGRSGIVTLAQGVFYGIGAYSIAFFCSRLGWWSPLGIVAGAATSGAIAFAVGSPVLRLTGYFLALATLALGIIGNVFFLEWQWLTGGTLGIGGLPPISVFGWEINTPYRFYYLVWPVVALAVWVHHNLGVLRNGLAMRAMRDAPDAAAVLGIDVHSLKVRLFVLSAVLGSVAGSLFAHYVSFISVHSFGVDRAISFLLLAVLGGVYSVWGPILGALFITLAPEVLSRFGEIHAFLFALALIAAVIVLPEGFGGAIEAWVQRHSKGQAAAAGIHVTDAPAHHRRPVRPWTPAMIGTPLSDTAHSDGSPLLQVRRVSHSFRGLQVLLDVNLIVPAGEIVGLIGPNGSGKTTLFNIISGFLRADGGRLIYDGRDITTERVQRRSDAGLVRTFQTPRVFGTMSVLENLMIGAYKDTTTGITENLSRSPRSRREIAFMRDEAECACVRFGLTAVRDIPARTLPGGQQRLLELARAYVGRPRLLLLDEPSSGLTTEEIGHLMKTLRDLNAEGVTILLVSHHMELMNVASVVNVLYFGQIIATGSMEQIQKDAQVREAYLGF